MSTSQLYELKRILYNEAQSWERFQVKVNLQRPDVETFTENRLKHQLLEDYVVWAVDTEFTNPTGLLPVPNPISVRDARSGHITLSTTVDYGSIGPDDLERVITEAIADERNKYNAVGTFSKHYNAPRTSGMSLSVIGQHLIAAGFSPDIH